METSGNGKVEKLTKTLQKFLDGNPAILIGSGCSVPYGLPTMGILAEELRAKLSTKHGAQKSWIAFINELNESDNLEKALEKINLEDEIQRDIIWTVWQTIYERDVAAKVRFLRDNQQPAITKLLNKFIQRSTSTNIITTNYDRLVEYGASFSDAKCCTGFNEGYIRKFKQFEPLTAKRTVNVYKVHGSIDWFKHKETNSLYSLPFFDTSLEESFLPQIVTPGNRKYQQTHYDPFRTVMAKADEALRSSSAYLCVGYGFNDEHIQPIIIDENRSKKKPIVVVTKDVTPRTKELFCKGTIDNCLIISHNSIGGSTVCFLANQNEYYESDYWKLDEFYNLWFE